MKMKLSDGIINDYLTLKLNRNNFKLLKNAN